MPTPMKGQAKQEYLSNFMDSADACSKYPELKQRANAGYEEWKKLHNSGQDDDEMKEILLKVLSEPPKRRANALGQKGDSLKMRFIEPGLVHYDDIGTVLVKKETLDNMNQSFVGRPVFNERHREVTSQDFSSGIADGVISRVWYEPSDGWFWADVMVWDPETKENCRNGYSLSCAYDVLRWSDGGGVHNNIPYEREVLEGEYTHLAIVPNPRYEGARIIYNEKGGSMKLAFWRKDKNKPEVQNCSEFETEKATVSIGETQVPMDQLINLWNSNEAATKAAEEAKAKLANASDDKFSEDDEIEIGGKKVTVKNLKSAYLKNAEDEEKKKKADEEMKNAEEKAKKDKEDEERKNAEEKAKKDKEDEEMKNSKHFEEVRNAAATRDGKFEAPKLTTPAEREAEGHKRYGSTK